MIVYESLLEPLVSSTENNHHKYNSRTSQKNFNKNIYTLTSHNFQNFCRNIPSRWELSHNLLLFWAFLVGIPGTVGFSPQLVVVSGLFGGNPFDGGI
jgi:predicted membrane protein